MSKSSPIRTRPQRIAKRSLHALAIGLTALCLSGAITTVSSIAAAEPWGYDLAGELMSPFCPGRTLASCPSPQAAELVQWMVMQEAAGVSKDEVIEILIERYGEEILGAPPAKGITLWAYVFPVLGFVVFGGLAVIVLRRIVGHGSDATGHDFGRAVPVPASGPAPSAGSAAAVPAAPVVPDDEDLSRIIDEELSARA